MGQWIVVLVLSLGCVFQSQAHFEKSRSKIDLSYHTTIYPPDRIQFQDELIETYLEKGESSSKPRLIFTAGPMGAGKTTLINKLASKNQLDLNHFIWIDPDRIKNDLPEYSLFRKLDLRTAATRVHMESIYLQEILFWEALDQRKNVILDRSFKGTEWHRSLIQLIRQDYPEYTLEAIEVHSNRETLYRRLQIREEREGRHVPESLVELSIRECPKTMNALRSLFDRVQEFDNSGNEPLLLSDVKKRD